MIASAWILFGLIGAIVAKLLISERDLGFYADSLLVGSKRDDRWPCRAAIGFLFPGECDGVVLAIVGSIALLLLNYRISLEGRRRARIGRTRKYSFPAMEKYEEIKATVLRID